MKILIVLTSHDRLGDTARKAGCGTDGEYLLKGKRVAGQNPAASAPAAEAPLKLLRAA